jgi:hypothetical protein
MRPYLPVRVDAEKPAAYSRDMASSRRKATGTRIKTNPFRGEWKIVSTDVWEPAALNEFEPARLTFGANAKGELCFIAISASVDYRIGARDGSPAVEFSWAGDEDGSPRSGRGWAQRDPRGLAGQLFIHEGDDAKFVAERIRTSRVSLGRAAKNPRTDR